MEYRYEDTLICPYCHYHFPNPEDYGWGEMADCPKCKNLFNFECMIEMEEISGERTYSSCTLW